MTTVSKEALRALVREVLDNKTLGTETPTIPVWRDIKKMSPGCELDEGEDAVNVNPVVDTQKHDVDPFDPCFVPGNAEELEDAIEQLLRTEDIPDEKGEVGTMYNAIKDILKTKGNDVASVEEAVRFAVRGMLKENQDQEDSTSAKKRKFSTATDVGGASFKQIAQALSFSVAGAKQAYEKALKKAQFLAGADESDVQLVILYALKDYCEMLNSSGELTPEEYQLLLDSPKLVADLDGFREMLGKRIKEMMDDEEPEEE